MLYYPFRDFTGEKMPTKAGRQKHDYAATAWLGHEKSSASYRFWLSVPPSAFCVSTLARSIVCERLSLTALVLAASTSAAVGSLGFPMVKLRVNDIAGYGMISHP